VIDGEFLEVFYIKLIGGVVWCIVRFSKSGLKERRKIENWLINPSLLVLTGGLFPCTTVRGKII